MAERAIFIVDARGHGSLHRRPRDRRAARRGAILFDSSPSWKPARWAGSRGREPRPWTNGAPRPCEPRSRPSRRPTPASSASPRWPRRRSTASRPLAARSCGFSSTCSRVPLRLPLRRAPRGAARARRRAGRRAAQRLRGAQTADPLPRLRRERAGLGEPDLGPAGLPRPARRPRERRRRARPERGARRRAGRGRRGGGRLGRRRRHGGRRVRPRPARGWSCSRRAAPTTRPPSTSASSRSATCTSRAACARARTSASRSSPARRSAAAPRSTGAPRSGCRSGSRAEWETQSGIAGLAAELRPHYDALEAELGARAAERAQPQQRRDRRPAARRLGVPAGAMPRNAPTDCGAGCGYCGMGCAYAKKRSTARVYLPEVVAAGGAVYARARAERILIEGGRARGVAVTQTGPDGVPRRFTVRANLVVSAAGTLRTPGLLARSGIAAPLLGRRLVPAPGLGLHGDLRRTGRGLVGADAVSLLRRLQLPGRQLRRQGGSRADASRHRRYGAALDRRRGPRGADERHPLRREPDRGHPRPRPGRRSRWTTKRRSTTASHRSTRRTCSAAWWAWSTSPSPAARPG